MLVKGGDPSIMTRTRAHMFHEVGRDRNVNGTVLYCMYPFVCSWTRLIVRDGKDPLV